METVPYFDDSSSERRERPSRDALVRSYRERDASRARAARARSQDLIATRRVVDPKDRHPLSTQESRDLTQMSREAHEEARARREARTFQVQGRTSNRELIDGRGSIDSRALNERNQLVGYTIDERDRHEPMVDVNESKSRWRSHDGHAVYQHMPLSGGRAPRPNQIGLQGGAMGSKRNFAASSQSGIPLFVKVAIPVIVVLIIILVLLLTP